MYVNKSQGIQNVFIPARMVFIWLRAVCACCVSRLALVEPGLFCTSLGEWGSFLFSFCFLGARPGRLWRLDMVTAKAIASSLLMLVLLLAGFLRRYGFSGGKNGVSVLDHACSSSAEEGQGYWWLL